MRGDGIDIMCIQETRKKSSDNFLTAFGYSVYLSGGSGESREWAGVGFILSPRARSSMIGFTPFSNRIASLRMRVAGGSCAFVSAYAPHNLKDLADRFDFYESLENHLQRISVNGKRIIFGDFNARLGPRRRGEEHILGPHTFRLEARHRVEVPNRDLLLEFCESRSLVVANTLFDTPAHQKATYHEPGVASLAPIAGGDFSMLDLLLVRAGGEDDIISVCSDRSKAIASHHFPVAAVVRVEVPKRSHAHAGPSHKQWEDLKLPHVRDRFLELAQPLMSATRGSSIDSTWASIRDAVAIAADASVPNVGRRKIKPCISFCTFSLIDDKNGARNWGGVNLERALKREVKRSARRDKAVWLLNLVATGDWQAVRKLRKPKPPQQTRLLNTQGTTVGSEERANTFADHLENSQWYVRPATLIPATLPELFPEWAIEEGFFTHKELRQSIFNLARGKSFRKGHAPMEAFKAMASELGDAFNLFSDLCNTYLIHKQVPKASCLHAWRSSSRRATRQIASTTGQSVYCQWLTKCSHRF